MPCEAVRGLLLQHDLGPAERDQLQSALAHLDECASCREALSDYDRLRQMLRVSDADVEPPEGWGGLESRLGSACSVRPLRLRIAPLAMAASVTLAIVASSLYVWSHSPAGRKQGLSPATPIALQPTEQDLLERAQLFDEVSAVFDHRANWVLVADLGSDMGLGAKPTGDGKNLLLVRMSISRDGAPFSTADLVVVPGQVARSTVAAPAGLQLEYEVVTSQADPTHLRISADLLKGGKMPKRLGTIASDDLSIRMGQILSVGQVVTGKGNYELNVGLYRTGGGGRRS